MQLDDRQTIGKIQLSREEADAYRKCPVYMDLNSGFYVFPVWALHGHCALASLNIFSCVHQPNDQNVVKCAIHSGGYTYIPPEAHVALSTPIFPAASGGKDLQSQVPRAALQELREGLRQVFPDLAAKPWSSARLCWWVDLLYFARRIVA